MKIIHKTCKHKNMYKQVHPFLTGTLLCDSFQWHSWSDCVKIHSILEWNTPNTCFLFNSIGKCHRVNTPVGCDAIFCSVRYNISPWKIMVNWTEIYFHRLNCSFRGSVLICWIQRHSSLLSLLFIGDYLFSGRLLFMPGHFMSREDIVTWLRLFRLCNLLWRILLFFLS